MIEPIIYTALSIVFIHSLFWDGMLLSWVRINYLKSLPLFFRKPLFECPVCMTSIYGTVAYGAAHFVLGYGLDGLLPFLFSVGGLLLIVSPLISKAEDVYGEYFVLTQERQAIDKLRKQLEIEAAKQNDLRSHLSNFESHLYKWEQSLFERENKQPIGFKSRKQKPSAIKAK
jgi:hypothetical protein